MSQRDNSIIYDLKDSLRRPHRAFISDFLDESEQAKLLPTLKKSNRDFIFEGGYPDATRKILIVAPDGDFVSNIKAPISAIVFDKPCELNHRNVLGTFMSLGVERDTVGDIAIWDDTVQVIVLERLADYFKNNLDNMKGRRVDPEIYSFDEIIPYVAEYERETGTAASNRIDAVAAAAFKTSRGKIAEMLKQNLLQHNHIPVTKTTVSLLPGDTLSLRGKGKIKIVEIGERTKKGRIRFDFLRYK